MEPYIMKQPTWNDIETAKPSELMKTYKMTQAQFEMAHRDHLYGANAQERRKEYDKTWRKER
jgi:hypothetical protein